MLQFTPPPIAAEQQPLLPAGLAYVDHLAPNVIYYLPPGLTLLSDGTGAPDFFLLRYHDDQALAQGGLLRFRLEFSALDAALAQTMAAQGWQLREVGFSAARFRLRLRSWQEGESDLLGEWQPVVAAGRELVAPALNLTARETQFLEAMLRDQRSAVEVEVELRYAGLVPGLPWLAAVDAETLREHFSAWLPAEPSMPEQIIAAFLALPSLASGSPLSWQPLEPDAPRPTDEVLLRELALRSLGRLFLYEPQTEPFASPRYRLRPQADDDTVTWAWDLLPPRQESRIYRLQWSVLTLLQSLDTEELRRKLFPTVTQISPFAQVDIHLINRLPFDPHFLRKVVVDLRYSGATGVPEFRSFTFDGTTEVYHFSTFYPAVVADFHLDARLTTTQAPLSGSGWPVVQRGEFAPVTGLVIEINRARIGFDFVRVEIEAAVFNKAQAIAIAIFSEPPAAAVSTQTGLPLIQLSLTAARPHAWLALPGIEPATPLYAQVIAYAPSESTLAESAASEAALPTYTVYTGSIVERKVRVAAYQLEVLDPDPITVQLDPTGAEQFALMDLTIAPLDAAGRTYSLQPSQPVIWHFFRNSVFARPCYRYRLSYVMFDAQGNTLPLATTEWLTSEETALVVRPPLQNLEV